jgi:DNA-binding IclR family transcriptional regulator
MTQKDVVLDTLKDEKLMKEYPNGIRSNALAKICNLPKPTVGRILVELKTANLVKKTTFNDKSIYKVAHK